MKIDSHIVFLILVFAAVFTAGQALIGLVSVATQKRKVNKRLKVADRVEGVSALVMELRKQRGLDAAGERGKHLRWLSNLIVASGVPYDPRKWTVYALGIALAGVVNVLDIPAIVLGGHLGQITELLRPDLEQQLRRRVLSARWVALTIEPADGDPAPGATGAAQLELTAVLANPAKWVD